MENLYNKASLVLTPQMVETGKVYSMKPEDRKGDFTFSRSTYATRVGPTGLIEKETQNLLSYSNTFDNVDWAKSNASVTSGQAGYDGSSDAWKFIETASFTEHQLKQNLILSGVHTLSVYAKAGERDFLFFRMNLSGSWTNAVFNLSTGVVASTGGFISANMSDEGNGWYKCSAAFTNHTGSTIQFQIGETASNFYYTGIDGYGIYIQDAQLEQGLVARDYIETTTTAIYGGITDNVPRLDYTDSSCPALLLEPQRTNRVLNSEYFGGYLFTNGSITTNNTTSLEGLTNASTFAESTASGTHQMRITTGVTSGSDITFSFYAKSNGRDYVNFWEDVATGYQAYFNLSTGVATNNGFTSVGIEDVGNGWYRCYGTKLSFSGSSFGLRIHASQGANFNSYTGDGTSGFHIYGLQLEEGSYATSYIPTYGSAVTRNAETNIVENISSLIGQTEGTLYGEVKFFDTSSDSIISLSDGTNDNRILFAKKPDNKYALYVQATTTQVNLKTTGTFALGDYHKFAITYNANDFKLYVDGALELSATSGSVPVGMSQLEFYNPSGSSPFNGELKQLIHIPTALTNQEAIDLTTL